MNILFDYDALFQMELINSARSPGNTARSAASGDFEVEYLESGSDTEIQPEVQTLAGAQYSLKSASSASLLSKGNVVLPKASLLGCVTERFLKVVRKHYFPCSYECSKCQITSYVDLTTVLCPARLLHL